MAFWLGMRREPPRPQATLSEVERGLENDREAHELLALVHGEFRHEPSLARYFDLPIVERIIRCVAERRALELRTASTAGDR